jgi:uncharacterized protein DUF3306
MDDEIKKGETFLGRWSRLKHEAASAAPAPPVPGPATGSAPELPPLEQLSFESDFKGFLHPEVKEGLRRQALKKLFGDPHFNRMDGLDVYIDDYNIPDPLPEGMLENLTQYQSLLRQREEPEQAEREPEPSIEASTPTIPEQAISEQAVIAEDDALPHEGPETSVQPEQEIAKLADGSDKMSEGTGPRDIYDADRQNGRAKL